MAMCPLDNNIIAFGVPAAEAHRGSLVASEVARASPSLDEASCAPSRISQVSDPHRSAASLAPRTRPLVRSCVCESLDRCA